MSYKRALFAVLMIAALGMAMSGATFTAAREVVDAPRGPAAPAQTTVTLDAVADAAVRSWDPDTNFGGEASLELAYGGVNEEAATLLRFDLSSLPGDAVIDAAYLRLYLEGASGADLVSVGAYFVTSSWSESTVTWNNSPSSSLYGLGADIDTTTGSYKSWYIPSYVQSWVDDPGANYGVLLWGPTDGTNYGRSFASREAGERVPQLEVTYHLAPYTFTGYIYEGEPEDTSTAMEGATVELWGDEDEWPEGGSDRVRLASTATSSSGAFSLEWGRDPEWPYVHVIEVDPAGANSTGARAGSPGTVTNANVVTYRYDDLLETGLHDFGGTAFWDRFPEELPDLIVTDFLAAGDAVCFQIQNVGADVAPGGHQAALSVDGVQQATLSVGVDLAAMEDWYGCFDYTWVCSGEGDTVAVRTDVADAVTEADETNNRLEETWACDLTPPQVLSGPTVSNLTSTSAVISWETDEAADSAVRYDTLARSYRSEETDSVPVTAHQITLEGLAPSTTYHFVVRSTDAAGNTVESRDQIFETLAAPDGRNPTVRIPDPGVVSGTVTIAANADDDTGVEKVEFYLDDELVFTDYSWPYEWEFSTDGEENGDHTLQARVVDLSGRASIDEMTVPVFNFVDAEAPQVNIFYPSEGADVYGDTRVWVTVSDDSGWSEVEWFVDGKKMGGGQFPVSPSLDVMFWWDTRFFPQGSYSLAVRATDGDNKVGSDVVVVSVANPEPPPRPKLVVTKHEVFRHGHTFAVELTVENKGEATASGIEIVDPLSGFQPISRTFNGVDYETRYDSSSMRADAVIDDPMSLSPGAWRKYILAAVPVLVHDNPPAPSVGATVNLSYAGPHGVTYQEAAKFEVLKTTATAGSAPSEPMMTAYTNALKEVDYLLVTNPGRLFNVYASQNVDGVLSDMASLAFVRSGALGYLRVSDRAVLRNLVSPNLLLGWGQLGTLPWSGWLHPDFRKSLQGYLLLVGETEIVPSSSCCSTHHWGAVPYTDHAYADTTGDGRPDLVVGRIIGDSAAALSAPLRASADAAGHSFDRDIAVAVSDPDIGPFVQTVEHAADDIAQNGFNQVRKMHLRDYALVGSFSSSYDAHDGFAVGDLTGDGKPEVVLGDISTDRITVYDSSGTKLTDFGCGYGSTDFEQGDRLVLAGPHIVMADVSADRMLLYNRYGVLDAHFAIQLDPFDGLAAGNVSGGLTAEIVVGDRSADRIGVYTKSGVSLAQISHSYEAHDGLAVGDVWGTDFDEILLADRSADEIHVFTGTGTSVGVWECDKGFDSGDVLAAGQIEDTPKDEMLLLDVSYGRIYAYRWDADDQSFNWARTVVLDDLEGYDTSSGYDGPLGFEGLGTGDIGDLLETEKEELFVACRDGKVRVFDTARNWIWRAQDDWQAQVRDADLIYFQGHGNVNVWDGFIDSHRNPNHKEALFPMDFNQHHPVVVATNCLSGNYQDGDQETRNVAESFLASGTSVYVGSTQVSAIWRNRDFGKQFFEEWGADESVGDAFTAKERALWSTGSAGWKYWVQEYNLYGDPKFGRTQTAAGALTTSETAGEAAPPTSLQFDVPAYVTNAESLPGGLDVVEIPGGEIRYQEGEPWIPYYTVQVDYPAGYEVQDVTLAERGGLVTDTGLNLATMPDVITYSTWVEPVPYSGPGTDWLPDEEYHWEIWENPDGSTTLAVTVYPFYYQPATTDVRFYSSYRFDVAYASSDVRVTSLWTDDGYSPQAAVGVDLQLSNSGEAQDVTVEAVVKRHSTGEIVDTLLLDTLPGLAGEGSYALGWTPGHVEPDRYFVEVTLKASDGTVLDRRTRMFQLGFASGQITGLNVTPLYFDIGNTIDASLVFENTGSLDLTGTAFIKIRDEAGSLVGDFKQPFSALAPGETVTLDAAWDTTGVTTGDYALVGYALYDGTASEAVVTRVSTERRVYLPLVMRAYP